MKDKIINFFKLAIKFARKYTAMLICACVVIAGVVLSFWPTQGWFAGLQDQVSQSIAQGNQFNTLLNNERHLPNVSLQTTAGAEMTIYPTQDVYEKGLAAVKAVGDKSKQILDTAVQINTHFPLWAAALPNGNDIDRAEFARRYKDALADDARIRSWPPPELSQSVYPIPPLMAGRRVSEDQIKAELDKRRAIIDATFVDKDTAGQDTTDSKSQADAAFATISKVLPLSMQMDAASKFKVYLESGVIKPPAVYQTFQTATASLPPAMIWNAQLWLWLDEDVATAVARANADAHNVLDAPVKQILDVTIKDPPYVVVGDPTAGNETTALTPAPDATPTGRVSNGMYDVVQFSVSLDVAANQVPRVLQALEGGQFITVLDAQSQAVDPAERMAQGFIYGGGPIVRLDLACEELLLHAWTSKLQPPDAGAGKTVSANGSSLSIFPMTTH